MTAAEAHLSEAQLVALLHGALTAGARAEVKLHLGACADCAGALAREAALDEVLWAAALEAQVPASPAPARAPAAAPAPSSAPAPLAAATASPGRGRRRRGRRPGWAVRATAAAAAAAALVYAGYTGVSSGPMVSDMTPFLSWQSVIFYIPLAVGILLVLGSAFGGHDHGVGGGHDAAGGHDHDHDADHHHGPVGRMLEMLGVGRVPVTVVVMMASLLFGGTGIILNRILASLNLPAALYGAAAVGGALVMTAALTGWATRLLGRIMPTTETYVVTRHDFAGCTGKLLLPADATSGYAQVKDREGNVHNIKCRTVGAALAKGQEILVVEYDDETKTYVVDANPVLEPPRS